MDSNGKPLAEHIRERSRGLLPKFDANFQPCRTMLALTEVVEEAGHRIAVVRNVKVRWANCTVPRG